MIISEAPYFTAVIQNWSYKIWEKFFPKLEIPMSLYE
jgi:hypothetical protein